MITLTTKHGRHFTGASITEAQITLIKQAGAFNLTESRIRCDACALVCINSIPCHEVGCPEAWRDQKKACFECGCDFLPTEGRFQRVCEDCANPPDEET